MSGSVLLQNLMWYTEKLDESQGIKAPLPESIQSSITTVLLGRDTVDRVLLSSKRMLKGFKLKGTLRHVFENPATSTLSQATLEDGLFGLLPLKKELVPRLRARE